MDFGELRFDESYNASMNLLDDYVCRKDQSCEVTGTWTITKLIGPANTPMVVGDSCSTSQSLDADDDLLVCGELEVDGAVYLDDLAGGGTVAVCVDNDGALSNTGCGAGLPWQSIQNPTNSGDINWTFDSDERQVFATDLQPASEQTITPSFIHVTNDQVAPVYSASLFGGGYDDANDPQGKFFSFWADADGTPSERVFANLYEEFRLNDLYRCKAAPTSTPGCNNTASLRYLVWGPSRFNATYTAGFLVYGNSPFMGFIDEDQDYDDSWTGEVTHKCDDYTMTGGSGFQGAACNTALRTVKYNDGGTTASSMVDIIRGDGNDSNAGKISIGIGSGSSKWGSVQVYTDGTGNTEVVLPNNSIGPDELTDELGVSASNTRTECEWLDAKAMGCGAGECVGPTCSKLANVVYCSSTFTNSGDPFGAWWYRLPENFAASGDIQFNVWWSPANINSCNYAGGGDDACWTIGTNSFGDGDASPLLTMARPTNDVAVNDTCTGNDELLVSGDIDIVSASHGLTAGELTQIEIVRYTTAAGPCGTDDNINSVINLYGAKFCYEVDNTFSGE
jgi:hypothetical protein